jgi:hypothetical protein
LLRNISPEDQATIASQLAQHPELLDLAKPMADNAWCKVETNMLETLELQLERMEDEIRASALRLELVQSLACRESFADNSAFDRGVLCRSFGDALGVESAGDAPYAKTFCDSAHQFALMHCYERTHAVAYGFHDGNKMRFVFQHGVEGVQVHIICDHSEHLREIFRCRNCFVDSG